MDRSTGMLSRWLVLLALVLAWFAATTAQAITVRLPSPPMGWSTWESLAKNVSDKAIIDHLDILESTGLKGKGYNVIQIDDGWMKMNRANGWISRVNYTDRPQNKYGPSGLPGFINSVTPGCMIADGDRFPRGMQSLGQEIKGRGFKFGLYTSGELLVCDSDPKFKGFYSSGTYKNLRGIDAKCFADWGVDLMKIDMCEPPSRTDKYAESVMRAWRKILPENVIIYNSRYGCMAKTKCAGRSAIYRCPLQINFAQNRAVLPYCAATSDLARLGQDMKPTWKNVIAGTLSRIGRGAISRPGFWADPDYLVPHATKLTFIQARSQFSIWCVMSAPLFISVDMTKSSPETIAMLGNTDAIRVNQKYLNEGGDLWKMNGVLWSFTKRFTATETGLVVMHVGKAFAQSKKGPRTDAPVSFVVGDLSRFSNTTARPFECNYFNVWSGTQGRLLANSTFTIDVYDNIFLIVSDCKIQSNGR